jgi:asparagine synthase (glutamine-hydrolysing)
MCGIAGFVSFAGHQREGALGRVRRMADTLVHRGPDDEGFYVDDYAALGHRRLSIIDLESGHQPMGTPDGSLQIVFNGEIYNFSEVRADLQSKGRQFRTRSDTEVILQAYAEWGEACLERLDGMFAFALWEVAAKRLLLARDRVGKKPLYYFHSGSVIAFASELKALRVAGRCPLDIDPESLDCYLTLGYIPAPRTIYKGVYKLQAAHCLTISSARQTERRYWQLSFVDPVARSMEQAVEEFEALLDAAVRRRLISEVPLGAFLSGGIDSSLVVASMARQMETPVITNSIGFLDRGPNELPAARIVADHFRTDHHEFVVRPEASVALERIAWHFDEPVADSSALPTWYLCQMTRQMVTVALSGDGGDEGFGGYTFRYRPHVIEARIRAAVPTALRSTVLAVAGAVWPASARLPKPLRLKTILENLSVSDAEAFYRDLAWLRPDAREELYSADFKTTLRGFSPMEVVAPLYLHNGGPDALARAQLTDIRLYLTDDVLVKVDRMSMAHSLEVRSPLLDRQILEFAARLPAKLKLGPRLGKLPLRAAAERRLPAELVHRPKRGFSAPAATWLRGEELRPLAEAAIFDRNGVGANVLEERTLRRMWHEHLKGSRDHSVFFWGLLMLWLWEKSSSKSAVWPAVSSGSRLNDAVHAIRGA